MLGVKQVINQKPAEVAETVQVLSAIAEIHPGVPLDDLNTKFIEMAEDSVPEGAVTTIEEIKDLYLKVSVMPGDWILKDKLTSERGLAASIPEGMVIVTIVVDPTMSHSGMLLPGNRIDLLMTYTDTSAGISQQKTITVLECVEVFAIDNRVSGIDKSGEAKANNITLLVEPDQGKAVYLAQKIGSLSTMLRPSTGASHTGSGEISQEFLTSSFNGSQRTSQNTRSQERSETYSLENVDPDNPEELLSPAELLDLEIERTSKDPGGSHPVPRMAEVVSGNTWTMEIYEGETLRRETIQIADADEEETRDGSGGWSIWSLLKTN